MAKLRVVRLTYPMIVNKHIFLSNKQGRKIEKSRNCIILLMSFLTHHFSLPLLLWFVEVLNQSIAQIIIPQHWPLQFPAEEI